MADDLGWGDTGYNGHPFIQTPHLDAMAREGVQFNRFYASSPVCSPTRGSCLTGRHPYRYGVTGANAGHLPQEEINLAELLQAQGYRTGHFGKWHLGTLTTTVKDSNRGGGPSSEKHYNPPWEHGFDVCFSTEAKVPTYDPMLTPLGWQKNTDPKKPFGTAYWSGPDERVTENLTGDDSRIIMDRVIPFVEDAAASDTPFFAVVWFHTPHLPILAGEQHRAPYSDLEDEGQNYFGCITAMDEQMGRLRDTLRTLGVADDTMLWFCSDNGPEGKRKTPNNGSSGPYLGRKRDLYEGGVRVPGLLEWPAGIPKARQVDGAAITSDYLPTILDVLELEALATRTLDGISLMPMIQGKHRGRKQPLGFVHGTQRVWMEDRYKLISMDHGKHYALYDLLKDPAESNDLAKDDPKRVKAMKKVFDRWYKTCQEDSRKVN